MTKKGNRFPSALEAARGYVKEGWTVIPVAYREKSPLIRGWPEARITMEQLRGHFSERVNIGVLTGEPSAWLTDLDIDCEAGLQIAVDFLPPTERVSGRRSRKASHYWYSSPQCKSIAFKDIDGSVLVELRSTGLQTVVPWSMHPSGERVRWESEGQPGQVDAAQLAHCVARLASACLLARYWPTGGSRQNASLALAGFLLKNGMTEDHVETIIRGVALAVGDEELENRRLPAVSDTAQKIKKRVKVTGEPTLAKLLRGEGENVIGRLCEFLNLRKTPSRNSDRKGHDFSKIDVPLLSSVEILERNVFRPTEWLVENLFASGELILLSGDPGSYKSYFALALSYCVARGKPFLGKPVTPGRVVYVDKENSGGTLRGRFEKIGTSKKLDYWHHNFQPPPPDLENPVYQTPEILRGTALIVIDSLTRFHSATENVSNEMRPVMEDLKKLTADGASVLVLHHAGKAEGNTYRGSTEILAAPDEAFSIKLDGPRRSTEGAQPLRLKCIKHRDIPLQELRIEAGHHRKGAYFLKDVSLLKNEQEKVHRTKRFRDIRAIIEQMESPNQTEIRNAMKEKLDIGKDRAIDLLKQGEGRYWKSETKHGSKVYSVLAAS